MNVEKYISTLLSEYPCNRFGCKLYGGLSEWHDNKFKAENAWNKYVDSCKELSRDE